MLLRRESSVDDWTERVGRWLAGRSTRRSFLGRAGQMAVLVAGGELIADLLLGEPAEARVCGQSGVSPKCATYDCDAVWGWCWYATGCCADGALKKICDCCAHNWPNVHGYCPSGTNVKCIVESCGADPRVMTRDMVRLPYDDAVALATAVSSVRWPKGSVPAVVVALAEPAYAGMAAPFAGALNAPLLLASGDTLAARTAAELQRLGARRATIIGPVSAGVESSLRRYGLAVERWGTAGDAPGLSQEIASWMRSAKGAARQFCVEGHDVFNLAGVAGAAAATQGYPLLIGVDAAVAAATGPQPRALVTHLVGPEASAQAGRVPGGYRLVASGLEGASARVARALVVEGARPSGVAVISAAAVNASAGLAGVGGPVLFHVPGTLDGARDSLFAIRDSVRRVVAGGASGALSTGGYYELQSIVNGFEAHKLIGVAGQGLPVIPQPESERPLGRARVASAAPEEPSRGYWTGRAEPGGG